MMLIVFEDLKPKTDVQHSKFFSPTKHFYSNDKNIWKKSFDRLNMKKRYSVYLNVKIFYDLFLALFVTLGIFETFEVVPAQDISITDSAFNQKFNQWISYQLEIFQAIVKNMVKSSILLLSRII